MATQPYVSLERAMNTSTSTGTGNMVLGAEVSGYVTLDQAVMSGKTFPYCVEGIDGACAGEVEIGIGAIVAGELTRDSEQFKIVAGEFTSGAQTFSAGTKRVYLRVIPPAYGNVSLNAGAVNTHLTAGFLRCQASLSTANATPAVMDGLAAFASDDVLAVGATFPLDGVVSTSPIVFRLTVSALDDTYTDSKAWSLDFLIEYPSAGNIALIGSPTPVVIGASAGAAAWDVAVTASGDDVILTVTGAAATNINWKAAGTILL